MKTDSFMKHFFDVSKQFGFEYVSEKYYIHKRTFMALAE